MPAAVTEFASSSAGQVLIGAAITVVGAVLVGLGTKTWRLIDRATEFLAGFTRDWRGEPERPGVQARPGVMERLEDQGQQIGELRTQMAEVVGELPKNGVPLGKKIDALWAKYLNERERAHAALTPTVPKED